MDNETISEIGTFNELMQNNAGFSTLYKAHTTDHDHEVYNYFIVQQMH